MILKHDPVPCGSNLVAFQKVVLFLVIAMKIPNLKNKYV